MPPAGQISGAMASSLGVTTQVGKVAVSAGVHLATGMYTGMLSGAVNHQDILNSAMIGGISAGVAEGVGGQLRGADWFKGLDPTAKFAVGLASHSAIGAVTGGIGAEIMGGNFGQGAAQGTWTAALGFIFNQGFHGDEEFRQGSPEARTGDWRMMGWDRCPPPVPCCAAYWLWVPGDAPAIWGGNYHTLTVTMGTMIFQGGQGLKFGDFCNAPKPPLPFQWDRP